MVKVVVTDYSFESLDVEKGILQPLGCEVVANRRTAGDELRGVGGLSRVGE